MKCRLKDNEAVEVEYNDNIYLCEKNCCNQSVGCNDCGYEDCMEGCEIHSLLGTCNKCTFYY